MQIKPWLAYENTHIIYRHPHFIPIVNHSPSSNAFALPSSVTLQTVHGVTSRMSISSEETTIFVIHIILVASIQYTKKIRFWGNRQYINVHTVKLVLSSL